MSQLAAILLDSLQQELVARAMETNQMTLLVLSLRLLVGPPQTRLSSHIGSIGYSTSDFHTKPLSIH